jgi:hypothetical protein
MSKATPAVNPNHIQVPLKSRRQMQVEDDDREIFRVLRMHRLVNERINSTLENAQRVVAECR